MTIVDVALVRPEAERHDCMHHLDVLNVAGTLVLVQIDRRDLESLPGMPIVDEVLVNY